MTKRKTIEEFISDSRLRHGSRYDYSKSIYVAHDIKLIVTCKVHGDFTVRPNNHQRGRGCPYCSGKRYIKTDISKITPPDEHSTIIALNKGKYTIVDKSDYDNLIGYKWIFGDNGYATARVNKRTIRMHRLILGLKDPKVHCDHINRNPLDNRRSNLRPCSAAQNQYNRVSMEGSSSKFKGVCYVASRNKWSAYICAKGKQYNIGRYNTEIEAAKAYDKKAKELHGEFARLNLEQN